MNHDDVKKIKREGAGSPIFEDEDVNTDEKEEEE